MAGDYNVIPEPIDAKRPDAWTRATRSSSRKRAPPYAASSTSG